MLKALLALFSSPKNSPSAASPSAPKSRTSGTVNGLSPTGAEQIAALVKARKESKMPLMDIYKELNKISSSSDDLNVMKACQKAASNIEDTTVERNLKGKEHEKIGEIEKAVRLYELNIVDHFDGSHPYDRLRILYTSLGQTADVIRVCKAFIQFGGNDPELKHKYELIIAKLSE